MRLALQAESFPPPATNRPLLLLPSEAELLNVLTFPTFIRNHSLDFFQVVQVLRIVRCGKEHGELAAAFCAVRGRGASEELIPVGAE